MKKIFISYATLLLLAVSVKAQHIVYHKGGTLYVADKNNNSNARNLGEHVNVLKSNLASVTNRVYTIQHIDPSLTVEEDHRFYQGIQSPYDPGLWLFVIDDYVGRKYSLWLYNANTNERKVLFTHAGGGPNSAQMFVPFEWTGDKDVIFLEAISDRANRHEGIYTYNIKTGKSQAVGVPDHYTSTPILSPDKSTLLYAASFARGKSRDQVHGISERILTYNLPSKSEKVFTEAKGVFHSVLGWSTKAITKENVVDQETYIQNHREEIEGRSSARVAAVSYKFPWPSGLLHCTTRDGNSESPGSPGSSSRCSDLGPHDYIGFDFDTPNDSDEPLLVVAAGKVIQVTYGSSGYGNHVRVKHDDGTVSLYGHMKSISVTEGKCVAQGAKLGIEGTTGQSSGDHIHFEREVGGNNTFPTFSECGCTPHAGYSYRSSNTRNDNYSCEPACPASRNFTSTISSGTYESSGAITASAGLGNGANVVFDAKTSIVLNIGFSASYANDNNFTAKLGGCASSSRVAGEFGLSERMGNDELANSEMETSNFILSPNPADHEVIVEYSLRSSANTKVQIYDMKGLLVSESKYGVQEPGIYKSKLLVENLANGIYFFKLKTGKQELTKKLLIQK